MKKTILLASRDMLKRAVVAGAFGLGFGATLFASTAASAVTLSDQPVFATSEVPGNLALALSVEWPTASRTAHTAAYSSASTFLGYFDPGKCYTYKPDLNAYLATDKPNLVSTADKGDLGYFQPAGLASSRTCVGTNAGKWSGNFLNWAATPTIDPFRWAMTGGRRVVDTATTTILEKAWNSGQGLFPDRSPTAASTAGATPFISSKPLLVQVNNLGFKMRITGDQTLLGQYYNNYNKNGPTGKLLFTNPSDSANNDWGTGSPDPLVPNDKFSASYTGTFVAPSTGLYTFRTRSDDGVRLYINGVLVIDNWTDHGPTNNDALPYLLTAGQNFDVKLEYYENAGGAVMQFLWSQPGSGGAFTPFTDGSGSSDYTMRVKVCDNSAGTGGVETNCTQYGSNYKPEGLIQQYSQKMRFSAFGYLNDSSDLRDGGVLRARQKFVGPNVPIPGQVPVANAHKEWDPNTGMFSQNPDLTDATATTTATGISVTNSGVMNYLNKFGQLIPGNYKSKDPVSELYYAVLRYFKKQDNVTAWTDMGNANTATKTTWVDGFPVITNLYDETYDATDPGKGDPIQYSCQRNFVLGIGDIYTWNDKNVAGNTAYKANEPATPAEVAADSGPNAVNAVIATNKVGALQGLGNIGDTNSFSGRNNSAYIAGLAYDANTKDIRLDDSKKPTSIGKQTVATYWVDVLEQSFQADNQFYLAAKYGGLDTTKLPATFDPYDFAGPIPLDWWSTTGDTLTDTRTNTTVPRPDNYFAADRPDKLVAGLSSAFKRIANAVTAYTTSFSLSTVQVSSSGANSYASQYDSNGWTGTISASEIKFDKNGTPNSTSKWSTTTTFEAQLAGTGWDTNRRIATWKNSGVKGVPFRIGNLLGTQKNALKTPMVSGDDSDNYLNYLRGDRTNERTAADSSKPYRLRSQRLGDIVNSKTTPVGPPAAGYSEAVNPGYAAFKTLWKNRPTMIYAGANDGMMHAFDGSLTGANAGLERFAYVPSDLFNGPTGAAIDGLAQLGNPNYLHHYYVDATPVVYDVDLNNAGGSFSSTSSDWHSILIGGLGKGGNSYYAMDVTDPAGMTTEAAVANNVLWEFTDSTMGFSYGAPMVVKTKRYGWVVVFTSGYNNANGKGYLYFVNPKTGALLEKVATPTSANGMAQASAYVQDFTDGTADAIYAADLDGQVWRFDVTAARGSSGAYPAPVKLAQLTNSASAAEPITASPLIEIEPLSKKRFVLVGSGKLLDASDIASTAAQSFYAIVDGDLAAFRSVASPATRSQLTPVTDLTAGVSLAADAKGWYYDFGSAGGVGLRMLATPTAYNGIVAFSSLQTTGNACSPSGLSRIYAIDFGKAKSVLQPADAALQAFSQYDNAVTDLKFLGANGETRLITGDVQGALRKENFNSPAGTDVQLLNWREVPTLN